MNQNIFEIISQLVKRLLYEEEIIENEEKLINSLREKGYKLADINQAFEFIFSSSEIIDVPQEASKQEKISKKNEFKQRRLNFREKFKLDLEVQGIIIKLNTLKLVTAEEIEQIIARSLANYNNTINIDQFWNILKEEIDDEFRLATISQEITDFKVLINSGTEYIN